MANLGQSALVIGMILVRKGIQPGAAQPAIVPQHHQRGRVLIILVYELVVPIVVEVHRDRGAARGNVTRALQLLRRCGRVAIPNPSIVQEHADLRLFYTLR